MAKAFPLYTLNRQLKQTAIDTRLKPGTFDYRLFSHITKINSLRKLPITNSCNELEQAKNLFHSCVVLIHKALDRDNSLVRLQKGSIIKKTRI